MAPRRMIAFLDILGFENILHNTSPEKIISIYKEIEQILQNSTVRVRQFSESQNKVTKGNDYVAPISDLELKIFSDTILIYSKDEIEKSMYATDLLCAILINIFNHALLRHSWLLRGAFAIGELYIEGNIVFGDALIRTYKAVEDQNWASIIVLDKTEIMYNPYNIYTCEYSIPFKSGIKESPVLNFFVEDEMPIPFLEVYKKLVSIRQSTKNQSHIEKIENTLDFFDFIVKRGVSAKKQVETMTLDSWEFQARLFPNIDPLNAYLKSKGSKLIIP